jgi:plasmid stabilization system protein ParE
LSLQVVFRPEAEGEALEVRRWYESRNPGLGEQFSEALASVISRITEAPLTFPAVHGETRRAVLRRFPCVVYFRATVDTVVVLSIHGRQDPAKWQARS